VNGLIECRSKGTAPMLINLRYLDPNEIARNSIFYLTSFPNMHQARFIPPADSAYTPEVLEEWSRVLNVKLYNGNPSTGTRFIQITLKGLTNIYILLQWILIISLVLTILLGFRRKNRNLALEVASMFFLLEVVLFAGGLALLEIALGYNPGEYLYGLPAQPSFLILATLGVLDFKETRKNIRIPRVQDRIKFKSKGL